MVIDRLIRLILPRATQFWDLLTELAQKLDETSIVFVKLVTAEPKDFKPIAQELRKLENQADSIAHRLYLELDRTFVTPIDREDLVHLTSSVDNIIDAIEHSAAFIVIYNTPELTPAMRKLIEITREAVKEVVSTVTKIKHFHKPETFNPHLVHVHTLENEADVVYRVALEQIFSKPQEAVELVRQRDLLNALELCVDSCEDVMDVVQSVTVKNG
jgi:predicted phosphate transport protein (TIGR00153 family)